MSNQPFKTDSLLPTSLPSATLGRKRNIAQSSSTAFQGDDEVGDLDNITTEERSQRILDREHERWNERIDKEIKGVVDGLKDLIELANIGHTPSPLISSTLPLHLPLRTSSLIRSSQNIRDIAHELKLLLLLGDEQNIVQRRDNEVALVRKDIEDRRGEVGRELGGLFGMDIGQKGNEGMEVDDQERRGENEAEDYQDQPQLQPRSEQEDAAPTLIDKIIQHNPEPNINDEPAQVILTSDQQLNRPEAGQQPLPSAEIVPVLTTEPAQTPQPTQETRAQQDLPATTNQSSVAESMEIDRKDDGEEEEEDDEDDFEEVS